MAAITEDIFAARCALPSCHSSQSHSGDLVLEPAVVYDQLVGRSPDNAVARAAGHLRVTAGDVSTSFLLRKLTAELAEGEGDPMPLNSGSLSAENIDRIRAWIQSGAAAK